MLRRRVAGEQVAAIAESMGIGKSSAYRDLEAAARLEPEAVALMRAEHLDQLDALRRKFFPLAEAGDVIAADVLTRCIEMQERLLAAQCDIQETA